MQVIFFCYFCRIPFKPSYFSFNGFFALYIENHEEEFKYQLLDRLRCDCKYFLGAGNRHEKYLWGGTVKMHIEFMYIIYYSLKVKPEWLTEKQIDEYLTKML